MSGIIGIYPTNSQSIADPLTFGLISLQNRGENGCGVALSLQERIYPRTRKTLTGNLFTEKDESGTSFYELLQQMRPSAAIGHALYEKKSGLQPIHLKDDSLELAVALDGNFLGYDEPNDQTFVRKFLDALKSTKNEVEAAKIVMQELDGRGFYNALILVKNKEDTKLMVMRDPYGGKPLALGKSTDGFVVASETQALSSAKAVCIEDIQPGSIYVFSGINYQKHQLLTRPQRPCIFELIYFSSPNNIINGINALAVRLALGRKNYERWEYKPDVVAPSPDSGRGCGEGFVAAAGNVPLEDLITKNPGAPRTFQIENPISRKIATQTKFNVNRRVHRRRVGVSEDSIVRGTVSRDGLAPKLRFECAAEQVLIVSYTTMPFPCYRTHPHYKEATEELAAVGLADMHLSESGRIVAQKTGFDEVYYNSIEDIIQCCGGGDFCTACATGNYDFLRTEFRPKI